MAITTGAGDNLWIWFRRIMWGTALFLFILPAVAMEFTSEVDWTLGDFVFAAILLFGSAGLVELGLRANSGAAWRAGLVIAVGAAFLTIWVNAAVGMIGSEDEGFNLLFLGVVLLALVGTLFARARPAGMALTMALAALLQGGASLVGMTMDFRGGVFSLFFAALWLISAALFHKAKVAGEREGRPRG